MTKPYQKCTLTLTTEETLTLKQLALNHRHVDFRRKAAGLLQLAQGTRPKEIARELDVTQQSVYLWLGAWRERGLVGLMGGTRGGVIPRCPPRCWIPPRPLPVAKRYPCLSWPRRSKRRITAPFRVAW